VRRATAAIVLAAVALAACSSDDSGSPRATDATTAPSGSITSEARTIVVDGVDRRYLVDRPATMDPAKPPLLLLVLHGGFGNGNQARGAYGWKATADRVVVFPDGLNSAWNAGTCCGRSQREGVDDVKFLGAVIDEMVDNEGVDPDRVFATGISNGGMMAYRLACELPGRLAGIAPVAASMTVPCMDPAPRPTSVLHIHGLDDRNVPFAGGVGTKGVAKDSRPSIPSVIERWSRIDRCPPTPPEATRTGPVSTASSSECDAGTRVTLITIAGAGHQWPGSTPPNAAARRALDLDEPSTALDATATIDELLLRAR
jgi:polyhydroxybutyrate depolymerase